MKILFVTLTALFSLFNTKSFATDVKISPVVLESFSTSFEDASEVKWSVSNELYRADFNFNDQYISAYFDAGGNIVAEVKNITSLQLPLCLQKGLKKHLQNLWITELFEVNNNEGTSYYVTLENADTKLVLKSTGTAGWSTFQKQRKS